MPSRHKIDVTGPIIERACQRDSRHCMVAEAIQAQHPRWKNILVDLATIKWTDPRTRTRYTAMTPQSIRDAIFRFDQGQPVDPFSFTMTPVIRHRSTVGTASKAKRHDQPELFAAAYNEKRRQTANPRITRTGVVEGGPPVPPAHLGGSASSGRQRPGVLEGEGDNVKLSGGRYRQYGLRQLRA